MYSEERRIYIALLTTGCFVILLVLFFVITILRYQRRKVTASLLTLQQEMRIQEMERSRIASNLHDDLSSTLAVIRFRLALLSGEDKNQVKMISDISDSIGLLIDKIRDISNQLLPLVLQRYGLQKALEELLSPLVDSGRYQVSCFFDLPPSSVSPEAAIQIYRIFQEIINNIIKHSGASTIHFRLSVYRGVLYLLAEDNGTGFDVQSPDVYKGMGLQSIRTRADVLQAKLYLNTRPGAGVRYEIEIPEHIL